MPMCARCSTAPWPRARRPIPGSRRPLWAGPSIAWRSSIDWCSVWRWPNCSMRTDPRWRWSSTKRSSWSRPIRRTTRGRSSTASFRRSPPRCVPAEGVPRAGRTRTAIRDLPDREVSPVRLIRTGGAVAERERSHTRPLGGVFVAHSQVLSPADVQRALTRMSHEVVERNGGVEDVVLVGLQTGGVPLAARMADILGQIEGVTLPVGCLDVAFYRDDVGLRPVLPEAVTNIPGDLAGKVVVLVDDVLFTGRTIRAALNALNDFGRARAVQLAVMVDRGHRELPIRPDYVGKNLPTRREEMVDVGDEGVWIGTLENK